MVNDKTFSKFGGKPFASNDERGRLTLIQGMYERILIELCVNRFKWTGLPKTIDERYLELTLFSRALCVFYKDEEFGRYLALNAANAGRVNMYDNPTSFRVTGNTMVNKTLQAWECVPIWANYLRIPDYDVVRVYAHRLAEIDRTIEINTFNLRQNKLVFAGSNTQFSMAQADRQIKEGQATLYVRKGTFDPNDISAIDIGVEPKTIETLMVAREKIWSNAMTMLGISNFNSEKKERLVSAEVNGTDEQVDQMKNVALNARKQACKRINELYSDLDIDVNFASQAEPTPPDVTFIGSGEDQTMFTLEDDEEEENNATV